MPLASAVLSAGVTLLALNAGYGLGSAVRGYSYGSAALVFWGLAGVVFGPVLGWCAHQIRHPAGRAWAVLRRGVAAGFLPGLLAGEAGYGLTVIAGTTPVVYWWGQLALAVTVLLLVARGFRDPRTLITAVAAAAATAAAVLGLYHLA